MCIGEVAGGPAEHRAGLAGARNIPGAGEARSRITAKHQKGMKPGFHHVARRPITTQRADPGAA